MSKVNLPMALAKRDGFRQKLESHIGRLKDWFSNKSLWEGERVSTVVTNDTYVERPSDNVDRKITKFLPVELASLIKTVAEAWEADISIEHSTWNGEKIEVSVGEKSFGMFTATEIMRTLNLLRSKNLVSLIEAIPVRKMESTWRKSNVDGFQGNGIKMDQQVTVKQTTTAKEEYILKDENAPHLKPGVKYTPVKSTKTSTFETSQRTTQNFTTCMSVEEKDAVRNSYVEVVNAFETALQQINSNTEYKKTEGKPEEILAYIFG